MFAKFKNRKGQGMTEYIIIVALIAVATIAVVKLFGNNIRAMFAKSATALSGKKAGDINLKEATQSGEVNRGLSNFDDGVSGTTSGEKGE